MGVHLTFDARSSAASVAFALFPAVLGDDPYWCCRCSPDPSRFSLFRLRMSLNARRMTCFWLVHSGTVIFFCATAVLCLARLVGRTKAQEGIEIEHRRNVVCRGSLRDNVRGWKTIGERVGEDIMVVLVELRDFVRAWLRKGMTIAFQFPARASGNNYSTHMRIESPTDVMMAAYSRAWASCASRCERLLQASCWTSSNTWPASSSS